MGDSSPAADKLMRSQGVRALPSFHFVRALAHTHTPPPIIHAASTHAFFLARPFAEPVHPAPASQWKGGKQIDSISGAKTQALQDAIEANM